MPSFIKGLFDFLEAVRWTLSSPSLRRWFLNRVILALAIAFAILSVFFLGLFYLWDYLIFSLTSRADWILGQYEWMPHLFSILTFLVVVFFIVGPLSMLMTTVVLSGFGDWTKFRQAAEEVDLFFPSSKRGRRTLIGSFARDLARVVVLSLLILGGSILSVIPFLFVISILISGLAMGKEWTWAADEEFAPHLNASPNSTAAYALGLGIIPAAVAAIPLLGVLSLPLAQVAASLRYRQKR